MGHSSIQVTVDIYGQLAPVEIDRQLISSAMRRGAQKRLTRRRKKTGLETKVETIGENIRFEGRKFIEIMARPEGFEPPTLRSEV